MTSILIVGSLGREHALGWKLAQSPKVDKIYFAPGNAGTAQVGENVNIAATDIAGLLQFARQKQIDLTVCSSDDPLALGIVDTFQKHGLKIWGATQSAARIESSKSFAKELMAKNNIPTAQFQSFTDYQKALQYVKTKGAPIVIKASGLALGKGVSVCRTLAEAEAFLHKVMVEKIFGQAGSEVVIEEFLPGVEFSAHALCDGHTFHLLPFSQDHKPVFNDNKGPNTGGMGTIAPLPWVTAQMTETVAQTIVAPALEGLKKQNSPFSGLLYPGLMQTASGPKVIEFNARFGDPETQSYMRLLKTDLFDILEASVNGQLAGLAIEWEKRYACCIVAASGGYPNAYEKGKEINGIAQAEQLDDVVVFHAGTAMKNGTLVTNGLPAKTLVTAGGRVLGVTATGDTLQQALDKAYGALKLIHFEGMHYRTDIGKKSLTFSL